MASVRQLKVAALLQKELGPIFQQEARTICGGAMVTVTQVRMSPDLALAKIYLSIFGVENKEKTFEGIVLEGSTIKGLLGNAIRSNLRKVPELAFYLDDSLDYAEEIDKLLDTDPDGE